MLQTITVHLPLNTHSNPTEIIAEALVDELMGHLYFTEGNPKIAVRRYKDHLEDAFQALWNHTSVAYQNEGLDDAGINTMMPENTFAEDLRSAQEHIASADAVLRKFHSQFPPALLDGLGQTGIAANDS